MRLKELRRHAPELGFTPQEEVRWLSPQELWRTALKVGLSSVFADYADRREVQAALPAVPLELPPGPDGTAWIDFVADLGDGFDPTFTVACLVSRQQLDVAVPDGGGTPLLLPRGHLLVFGGDEVYPTPSATAYEDRTTGPYKAALLAAGPSEGPGPALVALPGNHDWYDGLTAFLRVFTQRRSLGGWRTRQTRSYFAVQLPQRWWLVGLDTQLGTYIDQPQIQYFRQYLSDRLQPGDGVIVCAPTPTWVHTAEDDPDAFNALHFFERDVVRRRQNEDGSWTSTGATVRLWITGDRHHYARYAEQMPGPVEDEVPGQARQLVTCGLGGAYLLDTHQLPERLVLPPPQSRLDLRVDAAGYRLAERWPSARESRRLAAGLFAGPPRGLAFRNPGLWPLLGALHAALLLVVLLPILGLQVHQLNPATTLRVATVAQAVQLAWQAAVWLGAAVLVGALLPLLRRRRPRPVPQWLRAGLLQLVVGFVGLFGVLAVPWPGRWPDWLALGLAALGSAAVDGLLACYALAVFIATSTSRLVHGWLFSAQAIEDWKGFVRMRIAPDGRLTLYPIVVDTVCRDWELVDGPVPGMKRPVPASALPPAHLVEAPIVLDRQRFPDRRSPGRAAPVQPPS